MKTQDLPKTKQPKLRETIEARHHFTQEEQIELSKKLAEANQDIKRAEDRKKSVTSELKAEIDNYQSQVNSLAGKVQNGYELRPTECSVILDPPKKKKYYLNLETNQVIDVRPMNELDFQVMMDFEENGEEED